MTGAQGGCDLVVIDSMLGGTARHSVSQGEIVADLLESDGHRVRRASTAPGRLRRLADMLVAVASARSAELAVIAAYSGPGFWLARLPAALARRIGTPVMVFLHGGNLPEYARRHPRRVRRLLSGACVVAAPSPYLARALEPWTETPIRIIPNISQSPAAIERRCGAVRPRLLWMRSLHEIYGPDVALRAFAVVRTAVPDAQLTMAGPDKADLRGQLDDLAAALGLGDSVTFTGFLSPAAKQAAFADHDIFLNTSRVDNTPVSLVEAAGAGCVVVSTDPGGISDLFTTGADALLCPVDDADALAAATLSVLRDAELGAELRAGGAALAQERTWPAVRPLWNSAFEACRG